MLRTSQTHPLEIAAVSTREGWGQIGITFAPGKQQPRAATGAWSRDLPTDLDAIKAWGATAVVTLLEEHEIAELEIADLREQVGLREMVWCHWPIPDYSVPCSRFEAAWPGNLAHIRGLLEAGSNVLIHCKGGLGRAGMIAARLLVELGHDPGDAIAMVRAARGAGAIETEAQERWVKAGSRKGVRRA